MRTQLVLDDALVDEAMRLSGAKSKRDVVDLALRDWIASYHQRALRELVGQDVFDPDYDVRKVRAGMTRDFG